MITPPNPIPSLVAKGGGIPWLQPEVLKDVSSSRGTLLQGKLVGAAGIARLKHVASSTSWGVM